MQLKVCEAVLVRDWDPSQFSTWLRHTGQAGGLQSVLQLLQGLDVYVVGGAVRDFLFGRAPLEIRDIDLMVDAPTMEIFPRVDPVFRHELTWFGNRTYFVDEFGRTVDVFPVATQRCERCSLERALWCCDFSFNAIAVGLDNYELRDPVNGITDIDDRRCRPLTEGWNLPQEGRAFLLQRFCDFIDRFSFRYILWRIPDQVASELQAKGSEAYKDVLAAYMNVRRSHIIDESTPPELS